MSDRVLNKPPAVEACCEGKTKEEHFQAKMYFFTKFFMIFPEKKLRINKFLTKYSRMDQVKLVADSL